MIKIIDVDGKREVRRVAVAFGEIILKQSTMKAIESGEVSKGDVFGTAEVAALQAIKRTWEVLPHCHQILLTSANVQLKRRRGGVTAKVAVEAIYKTGVEMEALYGVSVALLTVWDMVKSLEKDGKGQYPTARIGDIRVISKVKEDA